MERPLIAHVVHHLVMGGLENGLVNLINHIPEDVWKAIQISLNVFKGKM
jgi:hypothetical protein